MSRADFTRARQLVRLRDLVFAAAMRALADAAAALTNADAALHHAAAGLSRADARLAGMHKALVEDPADAPAGLARIALAIEVQAAANAEHLAAVEARQDAEDAVIAARAAARRAQARRDAMADRALQLRRTLARAAEERAAIEAEEGAAAMRTAA